MQLQRLANPAEDTFNGEVSCNELTAVHIHRSFPGAGSCTQALPAVWR